MQRAFLFVGVITAVLLTGCASGAVQVPRTPAAISSPTPRAESLSAEEIVAAFKSAKLPVANEVVYSVDSDPNKLLGRPHQYVGKASWNDRRIKGLTKDDLRMTIETFQGAEELEDRRRYVETISRSMSVLAEYHFVHKNALLRLNHQLTPKQAAEYERVLRSL